MSAEVSSLLLCIFFFFHFAQFFGIRAILAIGALPNLAAPGALVAFTHECPPEGKKGERWDVG